MNAPPSCLAIVGPTASGKTALALALREYLPIEIISMDSALVYQGMDIGTAKPSLQERAQVPHHLIDICDATQSYDAASFVKDTTLLIKDITARGKLPVLVGGTMLYYNALTQGLDELPATDSQIREQVKALFEQKGLAYAYAYLQQVDALAAKKINTHDTQRIGRALEVYLSTGKPYSSFLSSKQSSDAQKKSAIEPILLSLEPADRAWLHERINQRFDFMLAHGFLQEVQSLRARGDLHLGMPSMRCVGYRQAWQALDQASQYNRPINSIQLAEQGKAATRQLAKRQLTWLRHISQRHIIACDGAEPLIVRALGILKSESMKFI